MDGDQVFWKLAGVVVQATGLVTSPGGSLGCEQVLWKLPGIVVQVAGLVTTPAHTSKFLASKTILIRPGCLGTLVFHGKPERK